MAGIMKTLWDESDELSEETLSTRSVLTDDYTSDDKEKLKDELEEQKENEEIIDETIKED